MKTIFITGSTGLIGRALVKNLNDQYKIVAFARNKEKAEKLFDILENVEILIGDIFQPINYNGDVEYIIHAASETGSKNFINKPVETIKTSINGTQTILEFAKEKNVESFVYLSSLEVYGITEKIDIKENDYGYIDWLNVRSCYSEGKRMAECLCMSYFKEYNIPVKIARLAQTFGTGTDYCEQRVFAEFGRSAIEKRDIVMKTKGDTVHNYCDVSDAVKGIMCVLLKGGNGQAYNIANEETSCSIKEMAELVANKYKINVVFDLSNDISKLGYAPTVKVNLNSDKLKKLGWQAEICLEKMFYTMIEYMRSQQ